MPDIQTWVDEKNALNEWASVSFIDGAKLETWLEKCLAVASYYAKYILNISINVGARSKDEFWDAYATRFKPLLSESVILCARGAQISEFQRAIEAGNGERAFVGDSPEEVIAFFVAAIRNEQDEQRRFLESKTLIIDSEEAVNFFSQRSGMIFIPRGQAQGSAGLLAQKNLSLVGLGRDRPNRSYVKLIRPSYHELGKAIETMGFSEADAHRHARACGRSITDLPPSTGSIC
jgi:hypothetical protein